MTAFDTAWALMKMPVVPGSLSTDGATHPLALFDDPISGERLPLHVRNDANGLTGYILEQGGIERLNEGGTPKIEDTRSEAYFSQGSDYETIFEDDEGNDLPIEDWRELPPLWTSQDTNTNILYQDRGYATALYDVIANLISKYPATAARKYDAATRQMIDTDSLHNERIAPADQQLRDGVGFWENAERTGKSKDYRWRVRDDL
tara:strand:+ start:700 stop:1311 length:612 start_codon:yes stop_codon:yes gene_type:complete